jgi:hypothetical protein
VIVAAHPLVYADDPVATRSFFRDERGLAAHRGRRVGARLADLQTLPSELGVHPTSGTYERGSYSYPRHHSISLVCDDMRATRAELEAKGATFSDEIEDLGFGLGTMLEVPGADAILLYEPKHPTAYDL